MCCVCQSAVEVLQTPSNKLVCPRELLLAAGDWNHKVEAPAGMDSVHAFAVFRRKADPDSVSERGGILTLRLYFVVVAGCFVEDKLLYTLELNEHIPDGVASFQVCELLLGT